MIDRICIVGGGVIGSLFAGHLARVCDVSVLTRRQEHAAALEAEGLRVSGKSELHARVRASVDPKDLPPFDVGIVATKAAGLRGAAAALQGHFPEATMMTVLNGLGAEEIVREHGDWPIVSAVTFMSGTRHSDTHVEYILDTETWLGPYEDTPFEHVREIADTIVAAGLKAEALPDVRPAQWSKLVFNAAVNPVAALTGLPHDPHFAAEDEPTDLGHLVHGLVDEGKAVAQRGRRRAPRRPVGDERPGHEARIGALPVDARGRRRAPADGDRADHRLGRAGGRAAGRPRTAAHGAVRTRHGEGGIVVLSRRTTRKGRPSNPRRTQ